MRTAREGAHRSGIAPASAALRGPRPSRDVRGRTHWLCHAPARSDLEPPFPGELDRNAPDPPFFRLIRLHRHSLSHLLLVGGMAGERERLACAFHRGSLLRRGPFVHLDGGRDEDRLRRALESALSAVLCERPGNPLRESEGGTLFLDRVSRLSIPTQHVLLRLLGSLPSAPGATQPCFGRLAAGSDEPLEGATAAGRFLPALFDILDKIRVELTTGINGRTR